RGGGRSLDDGVPGTKSPNRQRAGNGRKAIRSVRVVVDRRQGESACPQADEIAFAVRIRRVDGRDQARYIPGRTDEERRADRARDSQGNNEPCHDDPHRTPIWRTAVGSTTSIPHRPTLHWLESSFFEHPLPDSYSFSRDPRVQCVKLWQPA